MDLKRLTEWLGTAEGLVKAVLALGAVFATVWAAVTKVLDPAVTALGLSPRWSLAATSVVIAAFVWLLWRSFRRFARASRLERPDAFTLRPTGPETLIGRADDLQRLHNAVRHNRLVLLDGESGCGKSALVSAGLVPQLQQDNGLLPVAIRD